MKLGLAPRALVAIAALTACGPDYDRTDIRGEINLPLQSEISTRRISVPQGTLVKAHIESRNDDDELMSTHVRTRDAAIMDVVPVISDRDYAFFGIRPGATQIEILANGEVVLLVDAVVVEQPAAP